MPFNSNDKTVWSITKNDWKDFESHFLATQAKKGEQLVCKTPSIKEAFGLICDDVAKSTTDNEILKTGKGSCN